MSDGQTLEVQKQNILSRIYWWFKRIPRNIKRRFEKNNYEKHALREFEYAGWMKDGKYDDDMQELMCKQVLQLLRLFGKHGHSGGSHGYAVKLFETLAKFDTIGPIKGSDDEWSDEISHGGTLQNRRLSAVFKENKNSQAYYIDAIVFKGPEEYDSFTGKVEDITSRQNIIFPFSPKTFYIDVDRKKVDYDDKEGERVIQCGDGNYVYSIKDRKQLEAVAEYYDMEELGKSDA